MTQDITLPVSPLYSFLLIAMFCASGRVLSTSLKSFFMVDNQVLGCPSATFFVNLLCASQYTCLADVCSGLVLLWARWAEMDTNTCQMFVKFGILKGGKS